MEGRFLLLNFTEILDAPIIVNVVRLFVENTIWFFAIERNKTNNPLLILFSKEFYLLFCYRKR
jgi:hypothetical protein